MTPLNVRIIKNWDFPDLMRQSPGSLGVWDGVRFFEGEGDADYIVVLNQPDGKINPQRHRPLMQMFRRHHRYSAPANPDHALTPAEALAVTYGRKILPAFDGDMTGMPKGVNPARYEHWAFDVVQFFPSIDHAILQAALARVIADEQTLWLCQTILALPANQTLTQGDIRFICSEIRSRLQ